MTFAQEWQEIRALRAKPTGLAASDADRRRTYVAALQQAEELAKASEVAGYATRALTLFYSLSQAGRAIAAARLQGTWKLSGHGLSVKPAATPLLHTLIQPTPGKADSFSSVATAIGSPTLIGAAHLGALWAANPDLNRVPIPTHLCLWHKGIEVPIGHERLPASAGPDPTRYAVNTQGFIAVSIDVPGVTGQELEASLQHYPTLRDGFGLKQGPTGALRAGPVDVIARGPDHDGVMRADVAKVFPASSNMSEFWKGIRSFASYVDEQPDHVGNKIGYALPEIAGGECPRPLMLWWALLLGLSSLTRYASAEWIEAINLNASELAVSLERVLDEAANDVPKRILENL